MELGGQGKGRRSEERGAGRERNADKLKYRKAEKREAEERGELGESGFQIPPKGVDHAAFRREAEELSLLPAPSSLLCPLQYLTR